MGRIIVSENITLDGVVDDPTGEEASGHGGWFNRMSDADRAAWADIALSEARDACSLLLGRRSDAFFGSRWNTRTGALAERLNALPKHVVSTTIDHTVWQNGTIMSGDVADAVRRLKREIAGDIVVYASRTLIATLLDHALADELRLTVFPIIAGRGQRLFADRTRATTVHRVGIRPVGDSLSQHVYGIDAG